MKNYQSFLSENFQFLEMDFSIYLNRRVFVMVKNKRRNIFKSSSAFIIVSRLKLKTFNLRNLSNVLAPSKALTICCGWFNEQKKKVPELFFKFKHNHKKGMLHLFKI